MLEHFPNLLKYGISGLTVIFAFLTFLLLRQESQKSNPNPGILATVRLFMGVCFLSALVVAAATFFERKTTGPEKTQSDEELKYALARLIAGRLEGSLDETQGKAALVSEAGPVDLDRDEINYRRYRRAVFLNLLDMQAKQQFLQDGMEMMMKRGHADAGKVLTRIVNELPDIRTQKLRWLKDEAKPALQKAIEALHSNPMSQSQASAKVALPKIAWILNHKPGEEPTVIVTSLAILDEEIEAIE